MLIDLNNVKAIYKKNVPGPHVTEFYFLFITYKQGDSEKVEYPTEEKRNKAYKNLRDKWNQ